MIMIHVYLQWLAKLSNMYYHLNKQIINSKGIFITRKPNCPFYCICLKIYNVLHDFCVCNIIRITMTSYSNTIKMNFLKLRFVWFQECIQGLTFLNFLASQIILQHSRCRLLHSLSYKQHIVKKWDRSKMSIQSRGYYSTPSHVQDVKVLKIPKRAL